MRYSLAITVPFVQFITGLPLQRSVISEIEKRLFIFKSVYDCYKDCNKWFAE